MIFPAFPVQPGFDLWIMKLSEVASGPCRTEFSDVGFDFIVVGTNKI